MSTSAIVHLAGTAEFACFSWIHAKPEAGVGWADADGRTAWMGWGSVNGLR